MTKKELIEAAKRLKAKMQAERESRGTLKDIMLLLQCKQKEDFMAIRNSRLYKFHGGEYCRYLEFLYSGEC